MRQDIALERLYERVRVHWVFAVMCANNGSQILPDSLVRSSFAPFPATLTATTANQQYSRITSMVRNEE